MQSLGCINMTELEESKKKIIGLQNAMKEMKRKFALERISMMEQLMSKKSIDVLKKVDTIKHKLLYVKEFYADKYPDWYKDPMLAMLLIWKYVDGLNIGDLFFAKYRAKELSSPTTIARVLRLMKSEGEIEDAEHNKHRYQGGAAYKKALADFEAHKAKKSRH